MKTTTFILMTFLCFTLTAGADVLTFDDLTFAPYIEPVTEGYGGFVWEGMGALFAGVYMNSGYDYGKVSGEFVAFNVLGETAVVSGPEFDFNGAYLTAAWREGLHITVTGYFEGEQLYQKTVVVDMYDASWCEFNYAGVDTLVFESYGGVDMMPAPYSGAHFVMDDFTFNEEIIPSTVPVALDIMPGACPNKVNVKSKGLLPVVIAGSADMTVYDIDTISLEIFGVAPVKSNYEDVISSELPAEQCDCVPGAPDGFTDLVLKFDRQDILEAIGDVDDGDYVVLTLRGYLQDDTEIEGTDCVVILKKGKP